MLTQSQILKSLVDEASRGTQKALAKKLGVCPQSICDIVSGRRGLSDRLARKLGYEKVVLYRPITAVCQPAQEPCLQPSEE